MADLAVVLDLGSAHLRAGSPYYFPAENEPFVIVETAARLKPPDGPSENAASAGAAGTADGVAAGPSGRSGAEAAGRLVHPIVQGEIKDWDVLEVLIDHVLYDRMGWVRGEEGPLLLAEPLFTSRDERERLCQLAFEVFNVPAYHAADQAVLALYCVGRLSGLVVDIGLGKIDVAPVVEGLVQPSAARRLPYGGQQLTQHLIRLLQQGQPGEPKGSSGSFGTGPVTLSWEAAEALKKAVFHVAETSSSSSAARTDADVAAAAAAAAAAGMTGSREPTPVPAAAAAARGPSTHTLPDGQTITVGGEGAALGEALLNPASLGLDLPPLAAVAQAAVSTLDDRAARRAVGEAVLVCGGGSAGGFSCGLPQRLLRDMRALAPASQALTLAAIPDYLPPQALPNAAWMGGAALAKFVLQQAQLASQAISKADYDEWGPAAVHRKCS